MSIKKVIEKEAGIVLKSGNGYGEELILPFEVGYLEKLV